MIGDFLSVQEIDISALAANALTGGTESTYELDPIAPISNQCLIAANGFAELSDISDPFLTPHTGFDGENSSVSSFGDIAGFSLNPNSLDDYAGDSSTTGSIPLGGSLTGNLETAWDRDWFAISLVEGYTYQFDLEGALTGGGSLEDPYLRLRDGSGELIAEDDDSGAHWNSRIWSYTATMSGIYYLDAGAWADQGTGSYTISADQIPPSYSPVNGYGLVSAERAFEQLLNIDMPSQPDLGGDLWGLDLIDARTVWNGSGPFAGATGQNVTIAVLDSGVDLDHPEFAGRIVPGYDFVDDDFLADDEALNGHGTHVAGTIAGANDGVGITGVAYDANIMPIRVLPDEGEGSLEDLVNGIVYAADNGADVINLSLSWSGGFNLYTYQAIQYAVNQGCVVVSASGNDSGSDYYPTSPANPTSKTTEYPAAYASDYGIAVGAVDRLSEDAYFSHRAGYQLLDYVTAPGVDVYSSIPVHLGGYASYPGTSMAAPHVAGVAALLLSYDPSLTPSQIEQLIIGSGSNNYLIPSSSSSVDSLSGQQLS